MGKLRLDYLKNLVLQKPIAFVLALFLVIVAFVMPNFFSARNLYNYLVQSADMVVISCGIMLLLLNGSIDLSVAAVTGLGSVIAAMIMNNRNGWLAGSPFAVIAGIAVIFAISLAVSAVNSFSVIKLKIPSFIATMASNMIFMGTALFISQATTIGDLPASFNKIASGSVLQIPIPVVIAAVIVVITWFLLSKSVFGRKLYAIGSSQKVSLISGIPVKKTIFQTFMISGSFVALGSVIFMSRMTVGMAGIAENRTLDYVTAAVLGGTSVYGGSGSTSGTVIGVALLILINNSLNMLGFQWYVISVIKGSILLIMALVDAARITAANKN